MNESASSSYSSTRPLARKVAAFRDFLVEVTQREWVG